MTSYVKLLGNKTNPYPYMKKANLFVLPSYHESYGLVLVESMIVGVPVLSTATCAAEEIVGDLGFVCENSEEGIYSTLKSLLQNTNEIELKKQKLRNYDYQISEIEGQLDKLLNCFNIDK